MITRLVAKAILRVRPFRSVVARQVFEGDAYAYAKVTFHLPSEDLAIVIGNGQKMVIEVKDNAVRAWTEQL